MDFHEMKDKHKIAICVACYLGNRRRTMLDGYPEFNPSLDLGLYYIKKQIEFIDSYAVATSKILFTVSIDKSDEKQLRAFDKAREIILEQNRKDKNREWLITTKENSQGLSYDAWDFSLKTFLNDMDYCFLLEDDYVPGFYGFDADVLQRSGMTEDNSRIVKALSVLFALDGGTRLKAGVSNGVINIKHFMKYKGFKIGQFAKRFSNGYSTVQSHYLDYIVFEKPKERWFTRKYLQKRYFEANAHKLYNLNQHYLVPYVNKGGAIFVFTNGAENVEKLQNVLFIPIEMLSFHLSQERWKKVSTFPPVGQFTKHDRTNKLTFYEPDIFVPNKSVSAKAH